MKVKTNMLIDAALDWAVCAAEGQLAHLTIDHNLTHPLVISGVQSYGPSFIWSQGGPIIERELHSLFKWNQLNPTAPEMWYGVHNRKQDDGVHALNYDGPTPLIAAMRCYVASKLGDEVDVPEELV